MNHARPIETHLTELLQIRQQSPPLTQRQLQMLEAAAQIVMSKGMESLTLRAVAAEVGVKLPSVQHHFGNKDGLVEALLRWGLDWYSAELLKAVEQYPNNPKKAFLEGIVFLTSPIGKLKNLEIHFWACATYSPLAKQLVAAYLQVYSEFIYHLVSRANTIMSEKKRWRRCVQIMSLIEGSYLLELIDFPTSPKEFQRDLVESIAFLAQLNP